MLATSTGTARAIKKEEEEEEEAEERGSFFPCYTSRGKIVQNKI
jgi:hypothetical protein